MLYEVLTRTWLWLYWFVKYHSFVEYEYGHLQKVDCEELCSWLEDILKIDSDDYDYWRYENI